jgi:hypothetical protein
VSQTPGVGLHVRRIPSYTETAAGIPFRCGVMQGNESTHSETVLREIVYLVRIGPPQPTPRLVSPRNHKKCTPKLRALRITRKPIY